MEWYKTLNIHQKINLKHMSKIIGGIDFKDMITFFGLKDTIQLLYNKLKLEGFDI